MVFTSPLAITCVIHTIKQYSTSYSIMLKGVTSRGLSLQYWLEEFQESNLCTNHFSTETTLH